MLGQNVIDFCRKRPDPLIPPTGDDGAEPALVMAPQRPNAARDALDAMRNVLPQLDAEGLRVVAGALESLGREVLKLDHEKDAAAPSAPILTLSVKAPRALRTLGQVPRRRRLLAKDDSSTTAFVSSDDESTPIATVLPEVGAALADASLLYEHVFDEPTLGDAALQLMDLSNEPAAETSFAADPESLSAVAALTPPRRRVKSSRFTGVRSDIINGKWRAQIGVKKKKISLGAFDDEEDAARAYDAAVVQYRNELTVHFPGEAPLASTMAALPLLAPPASVAPFVDGPRVRSKRRDRNWGPDGPPQKRAKKRPPPLVAPSCGHACGLRHKFPCPLSRTSKATSRVPAPYAGLTTSLEAALADDRWDACQKWTFAHAAAPYPSAEEKAVLSKKPEWPPGRVNHWFSNMRKRKYLKLCDGSLVPRDAFEAQLYRFIPKAIALAHKAAHQKKVRKQQVHKQAAIAAAKEKVNCVKQTTSVDASAPVAIPAEAPAAADPRPRKRAKSSAKVDLTTPHITEIRAAFQREQATDTNAAAADRESLPRATGGPGPVTAFPQEPLDAPPEAPAPAPATGWTPLHKLLDLFADSDDDEEDA